jgi:signal transduction histidine kinase
LELDRRSVAPQVVKAPAIVVAIVSVSVVAVQLLGPVELANAGARAAIETAITLSALLSFALLLAYFNQARRLRELLLLLALGTLAITDFAFSALPTLTGVMNAGGGEAARLACEALVAATLAVAAFTPAEKPAGGARRSIAIAAAAGIGTFGLVWLLDMIAGVHSAAGSRSHQGGFAAATGDPVALTVTVLCVCVLVAASVAFVARAGRADAEAGLLAGASVMLGVWWLQYLVTPAAAVDTVTPGQLPRLVAYALLLWAAMRRYARMRDEATLAAIIAERQRIARDLHDGLAQDLAVIATHGQRLSSELGSDHPLTIAARRALVASRGAIVDLSASAAPTTGAALRQVAEELGARFGVTVGVQIKIDLAPQGAIDLTPTDREEVVRIAREAIVNAIRHGGARRIDVTLECHGRDLRLRISDDGCGIVDGALQSKQGFGLRTMRARADSLGGRLTARQGAHGGTEVEVLVS